MFYSKISHEISYIIDGKPNYLAVLLFDEKPKQKPALGLTSIYSLL